MVTEEEERLEETANKQIKAMHEVLRDLKAKAGVDEYPMAFYWFPYVEYAQVDRYGVLECWSVGRRGTPDERQSFSLQVDPQFLQDQDVDAFKTRFRAKWLPEFNNLRRLKRTRLQHQVEKSQEELLKLRGDIE